MPKLKPTQSKEHTSFILGLIAASKTCAVLENHKAKSSIKHLILWHANTKFNNLRTPEQKTLIAAMKLAGFSFNIKSNSFSI